MKEYPNFYENLKEAQMRLNGTIVCYDGYPHHVLRITDHKGDGKFRIYLYPVDMQERRGPEVDTSLPDLDSYYGDSQAANAIAGTKIDEWLATRPKSLLIRKQLDSPKFNKFRPFELGMCNHGTDCFYLERQPMRKTEQGLIPSAMQQMKVTTGEPVKTPPGVIQVNLYTKSFVACVQGDHPSAAAALRGLLDPLVANTAVAFDRNFAFVRGPIGMVFLAYKTDIVGVLPDNNLTRVRLGKKFNHLMEVTQNLRVFSSITI